MIKTSCCGICGPAPSNQTRRKKVAPHRTNVIIRVELLSMRRRNHTSSNFLNSTLARSSARIWLKISLSNPLNCSKVTRRPSERWPTPRNTRLLWVVASILRCLCGIHTWKPRLSNLTATITPLSELIACLKWIPSLRLMLTEQSRSGLFSTIAASRLSMWLMCHK